MQNPLKSLLNIEKKYLSISLILLAIVSCVVLNGKQGPFVELYDFWEHAACIDELSENLINPHNPLIQSENRNTLRYTPYVFVAAFFKKLSHMSLFAVVNILSILSFLLLLSGIYLFGKEYFNTDEIPAYILTAMLFLWGEPFNYSNDYSFRFLTYTLFYPSIITFNLSFIGLYFILKFVRYEKYNYYFYYLFLSSFVFISHPLTGSFFLLCSFVLTLTDGKYRLKNMGLFFFSLCITIILSLIWPYHSFITAVINSTTTDWYFPFRMYLYSINNIYKIAPALLALPIVFLMLRNKIFHFLSSGFILCACIYVMSYFLNIRLGERYLFFITVFLHLCLAWYFCKLKLLSVSNMRTVLSKLNEKNVHILFFVTVLAACACYQITNLGFEQAGYTISFEPKPVINRYKDPLDDYKLLKGLIKKSDIVMSDILTSWPIPAFTGARIIPLYHDNPMVPDNKIRMADAIKFYNSMTTMSEREKILNKYSATHILLNFDRMKENKANRIDNYYLNFRIDNNLIDDCKKMGKIIFKNEALILFMLTDQT